MADDKTLEYQTAVRAADSALTAILDQLERPDSTWTFEDRNVAAIAFAKWLGEHPDVLAALERDAEFEPFSLETYIELHSLAYDVIIERDDPDIPIDLSDTSDGTLIRRRPAH